MTPEPEPEGWAEERRQLQELVVGLYHNRAAVPQRLWHTLEQALDAFAHEGVLEGGDPHLQLGEDWDEENEQEEHEPAMPAPLWAHPDTHTAYLAALNLFNRVLSGDEPPERDIQRLRQRLQVPADAATAAIAAGDVSAEDPWVTMLLKHALPPVTRMHEEGPAVIHPDDLAAHVRAIEQVIFPF